MHNLESRQQDAVYKLDTNDFFLTWRLWRDTTPSGGLQILHYSASDCKSDATRL